METGLKRLWPRKRAKGKSSICAEFKQTPKYEAQSSGPAPQLGSLPFKPSREESSKKHAGHNKAKSDGLAQALTRQVEEKVDTRPESSAGIQPVFVGISRPATATSLARAVAQAADGVVQSRPTTSRTVAALPPSRGKVPKARYVDIFQITTKPQGLGSKYNEDVAARNLDLRQVSMTDSLSRYDLGSKYQEEVADRNASIELPRTSLDKSAHSQDGTRSSYESAPWDEEYYVYKYDNPVGSSLARTAQVPEHQPPVQQPRMYSMTAKALSSQLPSIPQEPHIEPPEVLIALRGPKGYDTSQIRSQFAKSLEQEGQKQLPYESDPRVETPRQPHGGSKALPAKTSTQANVSRPLLNGSARGYSNVLVASMPSYQVSPAELAPEWHNTGKSNSNNSVSQDDSRTNPNTLGGVQDASSVYSSSGQGKSSSLKKSFNLSNRTIMDLTGNDSEVFSEAAIPESYTESPVLRQAKHASLVAVQPGVVTATVEREHKQPAGAYPEEPSAQECFDPKEADVPRDSHVVKIQTGKANRELDDSSEAGSITPQAPTKKITFSKISTVASMPPRSSAVASNRAASDSTQPSTAGLEGTLRTLKSVPETSTNVPSIVVEPVGDGHTSEAMTNGNEKIPSPYVHAALPTPPSTSKNLPASRLRSKNTLPPLDEDVADQIATDDQNYKRSQIQHVSPPPVHASPESLRSRDFVHPSNASGVHARDFAVTPSNSSTSQQSDGVNSRPVARFRSNKHVDFASDETSQRYPVPIPSYSSTFDEEDFARKQIQAKAALLRLQRSLVNDGFQEDGDFGSTNPNKQVAVPVLNARSKVPTSIYTQRQTLSKNATNEYGTPRRTPMSYHNMFAAPSPALSNTSSSRQATRTSNEWTPDADEDEDEEQMYTCKSNYGTRLTPIRQTFDVQAAEIDNNPPASPGNVSLSSFPVPVASPMHSRQASMQRPWNSRRNSQKSMSSTASAFSIPYHMVPGRSSSLRNFDDDFSLYGQD